MRCDQSDNREDKEVGARDADDLVLFCFKSPQPEHYLSLAAFEIARELLAELPS